MIEKEGFVLRKWSSNNPTVLECIPINSRDSSNSMKIDEDSGIKVLGINWNPKNDYFDSSVSPIEEKSSFNKRDIISDLKFLTLLVGLRHALFTLRFLFKLYGNFLCHGMIPYLKK